MVKRKNNNCTGTHLYDTDKAVIETTLKLLSEYSQLLPKDDVGITEIGTNSISLKEIVSRIDDGFISVIEKK